MLFMQPQIDFTLMEPAAAEPSSLLTGLVAYWALSDLADATGNGKTLTNNSSVAFSTGKIGNAADITRTSSQHLSLADASLGDLSPAGDFGLSCWVNLKTQPGNFQFYPLVGIWNGRQPDEWCLRVIGQLANPRLQFLCRNNSAADFTATSDFQPAASTWYHIACRFDESEGDGEMWVNGSLNASFTNLTGTLNAGSNDLLIGKNTQGTPDYANTLIDEIGFWNRWITDEEITSLYGGGSGNAYPF